MSDWQIINSSLDLNLRASTEKNGYLQRHEIICVNSSESWDRRINIIHIFTRENHGIWLQKLKPQHTRGYNDVTRGAGTVEITLWMNPVKK